VGELGERGGGESIREIVRKSLRRAVEGEQRREKELET